MLSPLQVVAITRVAPTERWSFVFMGARNIRVVKPTKIELPEDYICVSVTAGGWQTGALIIKKH
nr:CLL_HP1_G0004430.mRNA.1.CDS.1 [Saccharomyces cerevisiae]